MFKKLIEFDSCVLNVKTCYLPHDKLLSDCVIHFRYQFKTKLRIYNYKCFLLLTEPSQYQFSKIHRYSLHLSARLSIHNFIQDI